MEKILGRKLKEKEVVHHIDGNPKNNSISNLRVMTWSAHSILHGEGKKIRKKLKCPTCEKEIEIKMNFYRHKKKNGQKNFFCSRSCSALYNRSRTFGGGVSPDKKITKLVSRELKAGLTGYAIAKKHSLNNKTVYNYIDRIAGKIKFPKSENTMPKKNSPLKSSWRITTSKHTPIAQLD